MNSLLKFFLFPFLVLLAISCQTSSPLPKPMVTTFQQTVMTVTYHITIGSLLTEKQKHDVQSIIDFTFNEIDAIYNKWNPLSEISRLNTLEAGQTQTLSPQLFAFLQRLDSLVQLSEGRFDPTIEPLAQLWKGKLETDSLPSRLEIEHLKPAIGWDKIHFDKGLFYKADSRTQLDLGGVAKGFCVDLLVERLNEAGFPHLFVEWGGDVRATGHHPTGRPWNLYISRLGNPDPAQAIAYLSLRNQAIATSGDYFQYWQIQQEGETFTFCHIFNPLTLSPLCVQTGTVASASLSAEDCLTADALAKVLMLFDSASQAEDWIKKIQKNYPTMQYWIVTR